MPNIYIYIYIYIYTVFHFVDRQYIRIRNNIHNLLVISTEDKSSRWQPEHNLICSHIWNLLIAMSKVYDRWDIIKKTRTHKLICTCMYNVGHNWYYRHELITTNTPALIENNSGPLQIMRQLTNHYTHISLKNKINCGPVYEWFQMCGQRSQFARTKFTRQCAG